MNIRIFVILGLLICCGFAINNAPKQDQTTVQQQLNARDTVEQANNLQRRLKQLHDDPREMQKLLDWANREHICVSADGCGD